MKQHRKNNCLKILDYIRSKGSITNDEAFTKLGVRQCPARIWNIKNDMGIDIKSTMNYSKNEKFAVYTMVVS